MGNKKDKAKPDPMLEVLSTLAAAQVENTKLLKELIQEVRSGTKSTGGNGSAGAQSVQSIRETGQAAHAVDQGNGGDGDAGVGKVSGSGTDEKVKERALHDGQAGAVSSFTPSGEPPPGWLPPPQNIKKTLFAVGEAVPCQECKKPVYEVVKEVNTHTKLNELVDCLRPYGPEVPLLTAETQVRKINAALNCPLCLKEWGVLLYAKA